MEIPEADIKMNRIPTGIFTTYLRKSLAFFLICSVLFNLTSGSYEIKETGEKIIAEEKTDGLHSSGADKLKAFNCSRTSESIKFSKPAADSLLHNKNQFFSRDIFRFSHWSRGTFT